MAALDRQAAYRKRAISDPHTRKRSAKHPKLDEGEQESVAAHPAQGIELVQGEGNRNARKRKPDPTEPRDAPLLLKRARRQKPKKRLFAFWQQDDVFDSATKFTYSNEPPDVQISLTDNCRKCKALAEEMAQLAQTGVVRLSIVNINKARDKQDAGKGSQRQRDDRKRHLAARATSAANRGGESPAPDSEADASSGSEADTSGASDASGVSVTSDVSDGSDRSDGSERDQASESVDDSSSDSDSTLEGRGHARTRDRTSGSDSDGDGVERPCHVVKVFDEEFNGWTEFRTRFGVSEPRPLLPHQKEFVTLWTPRSVEHARTHEEIKPTVLIWDLGSGKTDGSLELALGRQRVPIRKLAIVCPKSVLGQWALRIVQMRLKGPSDVWLFAPSYLNRVTHNEVDVLKPAALRKMSMIVDESQSFKNETESRKADLALLYEVPELCLLSGRPVPTIEDINSFFKLLRVKLVKDSGNSVNKSARSDNKRRHDGERDKEALPDNKRQRASREDVEDEQQPPEPVFKSVLEVMNELRDNMQISYYSPAECNPAWHRDHFPAVEDQIIKVPLTWTQLACILKAERKLIIRNPASGKGPCVFGDSVPNSYYSRTRGFCNSVRLPSGLLLSPKTDLVVAHILAHPTDQYAEHSSYLELGIHATAKKLKDAGCCKFVFIEGNMAAKNRQKSIESYNSRKTRVIMFSDAGAAGLDLKHTDVMVLFEVEFSSCLQEQARGRVIRYHSHDKGGKVLVLQLVSTLPTTDPSAEDWKGLTELAADFYHTLDYSRALQLAQNELLADIKHSLAEYDITQTVEEKLLAKHEVAKAKIAPLTRMLALAGLTSSDHVKKELRSQLDFAEDEAFESDRISEHDKLTFRNVCEGLKYSYLLEEDESSKRG